MITKLKCGAYIIRNLIKPLSYDLHVYYERH